MIQKFLSAAFNVLASIAGLAPFAQAQAAQFTSLYHFNQSQNGEGSVEGTLTMLDNVIYGAASAGGSAGKGTLFKLDLSNLTETTLFSFAGGKTQGALPFGPLSRSGAAIYGSTVEGHGTGPGSNGNYTGYGEIWRLNARSGKTRVFHGFGGDDGSQPYSGVTPLNGVFYGVTWYGGPTNAGTVFELDASGKLTQLYAFPDSTIGCNPLDATVIVGHTLYGTTTFCGAGNAGTVFALDLDNNHASLLYSFAPNPNGSAEPNALVYHHGALYGTTFADGGAGSAYRIDLATRKYTLLHQFSGGADGGTPSAGLTLLKGKLYGVTQYGGADERGTIYSIDPSTGSQAVVYSFTGGTDGDTPTTGLFAGEGALYGSTLNVDSEYPNIRGALFKFVP
jgi:uncharacterized repeat protein (TIGR03803 family)